MTVKLYENDAYIKEFEATVLSCTQEKTGYSVVLDQTAFFPEGGGQPADIGMLGDAAVTDVQIKDGVISHKTDKPLEVGTTVRGAIDWDVRFARMQNHTGEHLVSGLIHAAFGYDNVGFHMSEKFVTLDVSGTMTAKDIARIEMAANCAVYENRAIYATYPTPEEILSLDYRSKLDLTEGVRLITIDGYDVCACCAPHVARTGEIGLVKIIDYAPYKGGTRIEMVSGVNALCDYIALHDANRTVMRLLSASRDKTTEFVLRDHEALAALRAENKQLSEKLVTAQLQTVELEGVVCGFTQGASFDSLRSCTDQLKVDGKICALFSAAQDGTLNYVLSCENGDIRETVKALNAAFNGKGGGKPTCAQGKIIATKEEITAFFENQHG